ncbi:MAG: hypothetical protein ACLTHQ_17285 [Odoribacter splanchnicus]
MRANNGKEKVDRYLTAKYDDALGLYIMGYARKEDVPFGTLQRNVPLLKVAQQNELDKMLELAELVYHKKADELTELIEKRLPEMSVQELKMYAFIPGYDLGERKERSITAYHRTGYKIDGISNRRYGKKSRQTNGRRSFYIHHPHRFLLWKDDASALQTSGRYG